MGQDSFIPVATNARSRNDLVNHLIAFSPPGVVSYCGKSQQSNGSTSRKLNKVTRSLLKTAPSSNNRSKPPRVNSVNSGTVNSRPAGTFTIFLT
jgi:hypothetical protein